MATLDRRESQRLAVAILVALALHAGLYFAVPAIVGMESLQARTYGPVTLRLEVAVAALPQRPPPQTVVQPEPARQPVPETAAQAPKPATQPAKVVQAPSIKPRLTDRAAALASQAAASQASTQLAADPGAPVVKRAPGTPAFQQAGEPTGSSAGTVDRSVTPGHEPTLPAAIQSPTPSEPSAGQQRSGEGVSVGGRTAAAPLDLGKLDKSLSTSKQPTSGGTGSTAATSSGSTVTSGAPGPDIAWEQPAAARDRTLVSAPLPEVPAWVAEQGLTLTAKVSFSLTAEGIVTPARISQSSGHSDVDAAVLDAVRRWRFTAAPGASPIKGTVTYTIRPR